MAKTKYLTQYPTILKEKAKKAGIKIKKADYRFLDQFMFIQEDEYTKADLELIEESQEVLISFITDTGATVTMTLDAHDADEIRFKANAALIPESLVESVGQSILGGYFIDNYLSVQLTLKNAGKSCANIIMEGKLWMDCHKKSAARKCAFYRLLFVEEINQIAYALSATGYEIHLTNSGTNPVKVIKMVRELTGWGLLESKNFVNLSPDSVIKVKDKAKALHYCAELEKVGAKVDFPPIYHSDL